MRILHLSDPQAPFHHPDSVKFFKKTYKKYQCNMVIHEGDGSDFKYLKYPSINDPETAYQQHLRTCEYYEELFSAFPQAIVLNSNHEDRHYGQAEKAGIPWFHMKNLSDLLGAPSGWTWVDRYEDDLMVCEHGHRLGGGETLDRIGKKALEKNEKSTVVGHFATMGGVRYYASWKSTRFFMAVGCMVDINSYGMGFLKRFNLPPILGCGVTIDSEKAYFERFIP